MKHWRRGLAGIVLGLGLVACSPSQPEDTGPQLDARPADAPRAAAEVSTRFSFLRYTVSVDGDAPELCLGFTTPLDPDVDYASYVTVSPQRPIALSVSGQTLCIGGLGFGDGQEIILRTGLPAADGQSLPADETIPVDFGDRPAYVGIAGDGVILPRRDADGLAIETVNVDSVDIELWRVTDRALAFRSITQGFNGAEGDYNWTPPEERPFEVGEEIWSGEMDTDGPLNTPVTTVFPLAEAIGTLTPGAYYIAIRDAAEADDGYRNPARANRWLVITDLALTAYRGQDGIDFTVRSLQSARPVEDVRVELIAGSNEVLAAAETDADGHARFAAPLVRGEGAMAPRLLLAYGPDNDFAVLDFRRNPVDLSGQGISGRQRPDGADGYLWLDRGIYRPGETVRIGAMVRDSEVVAISDRPVTLTAFGPNGIEIANARYPDAAQAGSVFWNYDLPIAAARGEWRIVAEMDGYGRVASTRFSVEDFVPQRIALDLEADTQTPVMAGETRDVEANVRFLYGAPGAGLAVEGRLRVETDPSPFDDWSGFSFGRHETPFRERSLDMPATVADGAGMALQRLDPQGIGEDASQPLRIRAVISAIEPGGRAVADDVRIPYRPAPLYIGLQPQFEGRAARNRETRFGVIALDGLGNPEAAELGWQLVRIDWDYDWYRTDGGRWQWRRTRHVVPIETGVLRLDGEQSEDLVLPGLDWGNYQIILTEPASGISASSGFWVGWGGDSEPGTQAPDQVAVSGPDAPVAVGDRARLTILPPYAGEAEIVIASDRVLETRTISLDEGGTEIDFRVTENWGAGAYAMVTVYTPRDPVDRPAPRRAVGVSYLPVDTSDRTLSVSFDAPDRIHPRQTYTLDLQIEGPVRSGAYVSVAAVDEGILALTRFASPDPQAWYFGQAALDVDLYDDYGRLLDPNQGAAAPVRQGGDQIGGAGLTVVPTRTVALYSGPVEVGRDGRASVTLEIPDFNGELRLMAVAWTGRAVGQAAQPLTVRDDVPAELILPRFLAPGDVSTATLTIDNVDGEAGAYAATLNGSGPVSFDAADTLQLAAGERVDRRYALGGTSAAIGEVALAVSGPGGFDVSRSYPIEVRPAWLASSDIVRGRVMPGDSWTVPADALAGYLEGSASLSLSFSPTPLDEAALLQSLNRYPYGCGEQITSRALPLLYALPLADAAGLDGPEGARAEIQAAIGTLLSRQGSDGVFGLWRVGDRAARPWIGVYMTDFLARAKAEGYAVPDAALERAYTALEHIAAGEMWRVPGYDTSIYRWQGQTDTSERMSDRSVSYALYVLARAGRVDRSRLRYMHDQRLDEIDSPLARAQIAAALYLIGDQARTMSALDAAEAALGFENPGNYYQSARRDLAGVLALAAEVGDADRVARLADRVSADLPEPARLNTQQKAFLLFAARAMAGDQGVQVAAPAGVAAQGPGQFDLDMSALDAGASFAVESDTPVWVTQFAHGQSLTPPEAAREGLAVQKRVRRLDGSPVDLEALVQGDRLMVDITLAPETERLMPVIVEDLLPPGFEIEAVVEPADAGRNGPYAWLGRINAPRVAEARDDRYVAAVDLRNRRAERVAYIVRAVTPGEYTLPGVVAQDMYAVDAFARSETGRVVIAPRG
ncbi:alpha-2-macroglobulin family protein [Maricaulis parjimensis]|uniref:alpha-2-macroglobulin family protein n=1 Tax=Maricaulis parjimensis TaxID=144023 RepID=UPI00193A331B|nr:alpha-2-macroglobulin [Maricaulis parjimensis]